MSDDGGSGGSADERQREIDRILDEGERELPENRPRGILGEPGFNLSKVDDLDTPDLNAGISQELDTPVIWLAVVFTYVVFVPLAYVILWRTKRFTLRAKVIASVVGAVGIAYVLWRVIM